MASASNGCLPSCCYKMVVVWCFWCSCLVPGSEGQMVGALYVFGDSLADVGNNNHLPLSLLRADFPHNGIDFPGRKATGRFSNGKNTADFLAEKVGLPTSPPYLSLTSIANKSEAFLGGVNFASGGAGILDGTAKDLDQCLPLNKQIEYYSTVYGTLVQQLGGQDAQLHLSKSLFAIVIGSNDLLGYLNSGSHSTPQQFVSSLVSTLGNQLKRIYNLGARKLVFIGTGAIGCCPSQRNQNRTGECNAEANDLSVKYNAAVLLLLKAMKSELSDLSYSFFDTSSALLQYIKKPSNYGFTEVKAACCGLGNLNAKVACLPISSFCSNRKDHMFWDFYHPTEAVYQILTDNAFDGSQPYADPMNVRQLIAV